MKQQKPVPLYRLTPISVKDCAALPWLPSRQRERLAAIAGFTILYGLRTDRAIHAVCGLFTTYAGSAELWTVSQDRDHGTALFLMLKHALPSLVFEHGLHRVSFTVAEGDQPDAGVMADMGFQEEGRMRWAGPNRRDLLRYVYFSQEGGIYGRA